MMDGPVAHIGHVELLTPAFEESTGFFNEILGLTIVDESGGSLYMRGYGNYERIGFKLTPAAKPGLGHVGFRTRSAEALEQCVAGLQTSGHGVGWIEGDVGHGRAYQFRGPGGHFMEVYFDTDRAAVPEGIPKNRFDRRRQGAIGVSRVDHFNLLSGAVAEDRAFVAQHLGARTLDVIVDDDDREIGAFTSFTIKPLEAVFTADRTALAGRLHHVAFWVDTRDDVLTAADVFLEHGIQIEVAPALHTIGQSFFLYAFEPGGNRIEITTGADFHFDPEGPPRIWTVAERRAGVGWGTKFPETWTSYGTPQE
jgi:catechol 2,3-dioxygenase